MIQKKTAIWKNVQAAYSLLYEGQDHLSWKEDEDWQKKSWHTKI